MKAEDLLLTEREQAAAWPLGSHPHGRRFREALCRAQAAKVLAVLLKEARDDKYDEWHFITGIIRDTGLTWPPKEG